MVESIVGIPTNKNRPEGRLYVGFTNLPTLSVSYTGFSPGHEVCQRQIPHKVGGGPFQSHISESIAKIQQLFHFIKYETLHFHSDHRPTAASGQESGRDYQGQTYRTRPRVHNAIRRLPGTRPAIRILYEAGGINLLTPSGISIGFFMLKF